MSGVDDNGHDSGHDEIDAILADMPLDARLQSSGLQLRSSFDHLVGTPSLSWFLRAPFQISKRPAG